ncbi:MAG: hypothetical protein JXB49_15095 [Bacteroidales bacterium]|nr:hypothetical protein [Bacteroidales bacterium]
MKSTKQSRYWNKLKGKLEGEYPQLKNEDISFSKGEETNKFKTIANTLRKTKQELWDIIITLFHN